MKTFKVSAQIKVFPNDRLRIKNKKRTYEDHLIVANLSNDFYKYYSYFLHKKYGVILEPPPFGTHITISDGRQEIDINKHKDFLQLINNKQIIVDVNPEIYLHWQFFAVRIYSEQLNKIRDSLELTSSYPFHITIGKISSKSLELTPTTLLTRNIY